MHSIQASDLRHLFIQAAQQGKTPKYIIRFDNGIEIEGTVRRYRADVDVQPRR